MEHDLAGSITFLFHRLREGDLDAARLLWDRFFPRLIGLARRTLAGKELPAGAEDAVQTAFFAFFRQVESGSMRHDADRFALWNLLSVMTVRAARKQRRHEFAQKRGAGRVVREADMAGIDQPITNLDELFGELTAPDCDLICEDLLECLDDDVREIAILRLAGYTNDEIKVLKGCSLRSVERRMQLIRETWRAYVEERERNR